MKVYSQFRFFTSIVVFCVAILNIHAQTPSGDLEGAELREWLKDNYYDGKHNQLGYSNARMYMYNYIDNHNNSITGVYSGYEKSWTYGGSGTNPAPINCEHTVPQSFFGRSEPMRSDIHHLFPTYSNWNSTRSNHPFNEIDDNSTTKWMYLTNSQSSVPTSNIDLYSEHAGSIFEPREDHKGNCARAIFYFFTMYPTQAGNINSVGNIDILYQWHLNDPVDELEINRNNAIETYQGDRNPYIDMPELVARAWGFEEVPSAPAAPDLSITAGQTKLTVSWNDLSNETSYSLYKSEDGNNYSLLSNLSENTSTYIDNDVVGEIVYYYYATASNSLGTSVASNVVHAQLNENSGGGGSGSASDLFISEYVEGTSYNKAIEIANFTGADVDLSAYSIFKQSNGSGDWGSELNLLGTLPNGNVYIVVNSSAGSELQTIADVFTTSWALSFNGNDAVALFKDGILLDVVGFFNNSADFAKDVTLVRNASVTAPNTNYSENEWTEYSQDNFSHLGNHSIEGGGEEDEDTESPSIPTGLSVSNISEHGFDLKWNASTDNVGVSAYQVFLNGIFEATVSTTAYSFSLLKKATTFTITIIAEDAAGNTSELSTALEVTTSGSTGGATSDLLISEYVEGSSYNKAIEIANFTGGDVDLSAYSLEIQVNGVGVWEYELNFEGTLENGEVYVIVNNKATAVLQKVADLSTTSRALSFTGNDAVALFKNGVPIDVVGVPDSAWYFAKNVTMVRFDTITCPTAAYNQYEWTVYSTDEFSYLGNKAAVSVSKSKDLFFNIYPNPAQNSFVVSLNQELNASAVLQLFNVRGEVVYKQQFNEAEVQIDASKFPKGIYFVSLFGSNTRMSKKLVIE